MQHTVSTCSNGLSTPGGCPPLPTVLRWAFNPGLTIMGFSTLGFPVSRQNPETGTGTPRVWQQRFAIKPRCQPGYSPAGLALLHVPVSHWSVRATGAQGFQPQSSRV
eukprot:2915358-Rhodomonas_salina.1